MARHKRVLLVEPNYRNKYPPLGLMKLSTYHKELKYDVVFFKGELNDFLAEQLSIAAIKALGKVETSIDWQRRTSIVKRYIKQRNNGVLEDILKGISVNRPSVTEWMKYYSNIYIRRDASKYPKWSRICITTLFTFYWKKTIDTINFFKDFVSDERQIYVGGVLASINPKQVELETGIKPIVGLLNKKGLMDDNDMVIDELPLDYSILNEIDYNYPESGAFYGYTTRGCTRKCPFCAVPKLEPEFREYIPIGESIRRTREVYGDQCNLLLLDNNVLASDCFSQIIEEIKTSGFVKGSTFTQPNQLDIIYSNLQQGTNDKAFISVFRSLIGSLKSRVKGNTINELENIIEKYSLEDEFSNLKKGIFKAYEELKPIYEKYRNKSKKQRKVDFNQGVDARYINEENIKLLSQIPINPLRIAFDDLNFEKVYVKAVRLAAKYGINHLSNYLLYNYKDTPESLYKRLKINVELCEELDIDIYSFPMKYNPISGAFSRNRDFIGEKWNKKHIRAIQAILNSTKGKIGRGKSFFEEAFGSNVDEFNKILWMPETFIIYRFFFKENGLTEEWWKYWTRLSSTEKETTKDIVSTNRFSNVEIDSFNKNIKSVIEFYLIDREQIVKNKNLIKEHTDNLTGDSFSAYEYSLLPPLIETKQLECLD